MAEAGDFFAKPWEILVIRLRMAKGWRYRFSIGFWLIRAGAALVSSRVTISVTGINPGDSEPNVESSGQGLEKLRKIHAAGEVHAIRESDRACSLGELLRATPAAEIRERIDMVRNVTGIPLESMGLDSLEFRGPAGEREPLLGLIVQPGQSVEEALRETVAKRGEGWSIWFVTPPAGAFVTASSTIETGPGRP
jgi:hypothetical protein